MASRQLNLITEFEPGYVYPKEELLKTAERLYKGVKPAKKELQYTLARYDGLFGKRKAYTQNWPLYEKACSQEKLMFFTILKDAADHLMIDYDYKGNGRPPAYILDIVKALCIKAYNNYSSWRTHSELRIAQALGVINYIPKRSTLNKYLQSPKVAELLHKLYRTIAEPLAEVELYFAADATGISNAYGNKRWSEVRHKQGEAKEARKYTKLHVVSGVKTNVICAAKISKGTSHESPYFKPLLDETAKIFNVKEISADAGYLSKDNIKAAARIKAAPYIMGKKNITVNSKGRSQWNSMLKLWKNHQMFFAQHYHKRSNVESTFGMLKRKWGSYCRSKLPTSQENEILCKIVCHNTAVLSEALLQYHLRKGFIASL